MTGSDLRHIRRSLNMSVRAFGLFVGYEGAHINVQIRQMESGKRPIPPWLEEAAKNLAKPHHAEA